MPDHAARAALSAHFTPDQVTADLAQYSPAEVWQQRVRLDSSGHLAQYKPGDELANAQLTCQFIIPTDTCGPQPWPTSVPPARWACGSAEATSCPN